MSKLLIKNFEGGAEILSSSADGSRFLTIAFDIKYEGYIYLGSVSKGFKGKECTLDISTLADGEYVGKLVLKDKSISLPAIQKINGVVIPKDYDLTHLRRLSIRDAILSERISELEKRIKATEEKVFGPGILG